MKTMFAALALAIAIPGIAHARAASVPPPPAPEKKMECDKHGQAGAGGDEHAGHDMSRPRQPRKPKQ